MDTREQARTTARLLVSQARTGDLNGVSRVVRLLSEPAMPHRGRLRQVLVELLGASATMVARQTGGLGPNTTVVLDLRRIDGSTVDIDELRPEVRAVVRALLAKVHGHDEDVTTQIGLALGGRPEGLVDGVSLVLLWTVSAMAWCEEHDEPAPGWLATAA